jgi:hypothetical protein
MTTENTSTATRRIALKERPATWARLLSAMMRENIAFERELEVSLSNGRVRAVFDVWAENYYEVADHMKRIGIAPEFALRNRFSRLETEAQEPMPAAPAVGDEKFAELCALFPSLAEYGVCVGKLIGAGIGVSRRNTGTFRIADYEFLSAAFDVPTNQLESALVVMDTLGVEPYRITGYTPYPEAPDDDDLSSMTDAEINAAIRDELEDNEPYPDFEKAPPRDNDEERAYDPDGKDFPIPTRFACSRITF